jgi:hypothetical protein
MAHKLAEEAEEAERQRKTEHRKTRKAANEMKRQAKLRRETAVKKAEAEAVSIVDAESLLYVCLIYRLGNVSAGQEGTEGQDQDRGNGDRRRFTECLKMPFMPDTWCPM